MPNVGSIAYNAVTTSTTPITLETQSRFSQAPVTGNDVIEKWINLDNAALPQVETITIATPVPVADSYFRVIIDDVGTANDRVYTLEFLTASSWTSAIVATRLAELINSNPDLNAVAVGSTVVITAATPGTTGAFTCTVGTFAKADNTAVTGKISTATTTAASGTGKLRKLLKVELALLEVNGSPTLQTVNGIWYDGTSPGASKQTFGPTNYTGPIKYDDLRNVV